MAPEQAFDVLTEELGLALEAHGLNLDARADGAIVEGTSRVGSIQEWSPGKRISFTWRAKTWEQAEPTNILVALEDHGGGTRVTIEVHDWGSVLGDSKEELLGWFAGEVVAPLFSAAAPSRLGDWITDRRARRPSGARSRSFYGTPIYHWPNFLAILGVLSLGPSDYLLEIGCGGGAFLHEALKSGCKAAAVDHSGDMVRLATEANRDAIANGRLTIKKADAAALPYPDNTFSSAVMTGVIGFIPDPLKTFKEVYRTLDRNGLFVVFTSSKELKGTPAAPEPMASRLHFYEDNELEDLARRAQFAEARVEDPSLYEYAKKSGVPASDLELFAGTTASQLLIARKL
jgi:ubiquinone/menaquinone biosynthesis C-methylase UbiE/uncharacterized protein YndB with AHSA1/START domain